MPAVLGIRERPGVTDLLPEHKGIDSGNRDRYRDPREGSQAVPVVPGQQGECREEREPGRPGQDREPGDEARLREAVALGERECAENERGTVTRCRRPGGRGPWEDGEVENSPPRAFNTQVIFGQAVEENNEPRQQTREITSPART